MLYFLKRLFHLLGSSLAVQWSGPSLSLPRGPNPLPDWGTRIPRICTGFGQTAAGRRHGRGSGSSLHHAGPQDRLRFHALGTDCRRAQLQPSSPLQPETRHPPTHHPLPPPPLPPQILAQRLRKGSQSLPSMQTPNSFVDGLPVLASVLMKKQHTESISLYHARIHTHTQTHTCPPAPAPPRFSDPSLSPHRGHTDSALPALPLTAQPRVWRTQAPSCRQIPAF